jgi:uncharacterized protein with PIN domain
MFRLYLSLAGSRSFITWVTMVTNVAMHEIATEVLRCTDCEDSMVQVSGFAPVPRYQLTFTCFRCGNFWVHEVSTDE